MAIREDGLDCTNQFMKTKIVSTTAVLLINMGISALGQNIPMAQSSTPAPVTGNPGPIPLYRDSELNVEAFGLGTVNQWTLDHLSGQRIAHHGRLGAGAGLEYFFMRYVGVEAEGYSETTHHSFVNNLGGNLVLRLPIADTGFAPYIFGGGGHQFEPVDGSYGDGGAGVEYRFMANFAVFVDGRFVATERIGNYGMGRLGVKFSF